MESSILWNIKKKKYVTNYKILKFLEFKTFSLIHIDPKHFILNLSIGEVNLPYYYIFFPKEIKFGSLKPLPFKNITKIKRPEAHMGRTELNCLHELLRMQYFIWIFLIYGCVKMKSRYVCGKSSVIYLFQWKLALQKFVCFFLIHSCDAKLHNISFRTRLLEWYAEKSYSIFRPSIGFLEKELTQIVYFWLSFFTIMNILYKYYM